MSDNTENPVRNIDIIPNTYVRIDMPANINLLVGNPPAAGWDQLHKQFKIMLGEWNELVKNFNEKNYEGLVDDTQDLLFTLIGFTYAAGMLPDFAENFYRVCDSQFNKFDKTPEEAEKTKAKYEAQGMSVVTEIVQLADSRIYITKSAIEQINPGRNESIPAGKWLKSHLFTEPSLIISQHPIFDTPATYTTTYTSTAPVVEVTES